MLLFLRHQRTSVGVIHGIYVEWEWISFLPLLSYEFRAEIYGTASWTIIFVAYQPIFSVIVSFHAS